jgi:putative transposase
MNGQKNSPADLIDSLLANCKKPEDLVGEHGLLKRLAQSMTKRDLHESEQAAMLSIRKFDHD